MNRHHRAALLTIAAAVTLDLAFGIGFAAAGHVSIGDGLFLATAVGSTSGYASVPVHGWLPHLLVTGMFLTVIPLITATFSLFTSGLASVHVAESEKRIKTHVEDRLRHHLNGDSHDPHG